MSQPMSIRPIIGDTLKPIKIPLYFQPLPKQIKITPIVCPHCGRKVTLT